jgi:hypothetical protein
VSEPRDVADALSGEREHRLGDEPVVAAVGEVVGAEQDDGFGPAEQGAHRLLGWLCGEDLAGELLLVGVPVVVWPVVGEEGFRRGELEHLIVGDACDALEEEGEVRLVGPGDVADVGVAACVGERGGPD